MNEFYFCKIKPTEETNFLGEITGAKNLGNGIILYTIIFQDQSASKALGLSLLPYILTVVRNLMNGVSSGLGLSMPVQYVNTLIQIVVSHALLTDASYANGLTKTFAAYSALVGLQCRLNPSKALKSWGFPKAKKGYSDDYLVVMKGFGHQSLCNAVVAWFLANDTEINMVIGYSSVPLFLSFLGWIFFEDDFDGSDKKRLIPWAILPGSAIITYLLPSLTALKSDEAVEH